MMHRDIPVTPGLLSDGSAPYFRGRNGFASLGSMTVEAGRTRAEVRLEVRSSRWVKDPPALVMMTPETARELAAALIAAADHEEPIA